MSDALRAEIKAALVRSLRLPMAPEEIGDSTPLFGFEFLRLGVTAPRLHGLLNQTA